MNKVASQVFKATAIETRESFQHFVLELLGRSYPERRFAFSVNPEIITLGEIQLGLQNLFARVRTEGPDEAKLEVAIREHFDEVLRAIDSQPRGSESWEGAQHVVRLQLLPVEDALTDVPSAKLGRDVISVVVESIGLMHQAVSRRSIRAWGVSEEAVRDQAERNLLAASTSLSFDVFGAQSECLALVRATVSTPRGSWFRPFGTRSPGAWALRS
ncbi:MAG: hypothetical protein Q8L48_42585 [Archangium sp.]|nr:hypothetical protein [Archangium sp.]